MKNSLFKGLAVVTAMLGSFSFAPQVTAATAANWVNCASEYQDCYFHNSSNQITSMRYGTAGNYRYMWQRNRYNNKLPCNNHAGDPDPGNEKGCQFSKYNFYDIPNNDTDWNYLCNEGQWCIAPGGSEVRWMRYGAGGRYFYQPVSPNQLFHCHHNHMFGDQDPNYGAGKQCWIAKTGLDSTIGLGDQNDFVYCANENQTCTLPSKRPTIVRYGAYDGSNGRYRYITAVVSNGAVACKNSSFSEDPLSGANKYCEYLPIEYKTESDYSAWGQWVAVADNESTGSKTIDLQIWTGVVKTDTDSSSQDWTHSITVGMEAEGLSIGPAKVKAKIDVTNSYTHSSSFTQALAISEQYRTGVNCSTDSGFLKMWRFETDISFTNCLSEGICDFKVRPLSTVCTSADVIPQCAPGDCVENTNCQACKSD